MPVRLIALDIDGTLLDSRWRFRKPIERPSLKRPNVVLKLRWLPAGATTLPFRWYRKIDSPLTMIVNNGALIRSKEGRTQVRHLLPRAVANKTLEVTKPWRECAAVIFDRPSAEQVMIESLNPDDSLRAGYYSRNREFIAFAKPLETCLTEDPIQVMFNGDVVGMRQLAAQLRRAVCKEFALVTIYAKKICDDRCDQPVVLKRLLAGGVGSAARH
jgi:hypothetical protein